MTALDFGLEFSGFFQDAIEDFGFGDVCDFLALDVDDAAVGAGEDGDVCAFAFAGAVDDAAHDGDFDGECDFFLEGFADVLDEGEEVDLDSATGGAADEFGADAGAEVEDVEEFQAVLDFVDGIVGIGESDGIADALGEEVAERDDAADSAGFAGTGVGDAKVQRMVEAFGDFLVGVDGEEGIDGFGGDGDVVEISVVEDIEIFFEFGDHDGEQVAVLGVGEEAAEFLEAFLLVVAFDDGAFVDANADGDATFFAGVDDFFDMVAVVDIAGVETDFVHAGFDGLHRTLEMEMHVGDDRDSAPLYLRENFLERLGVFAFRDGDADDVGAGCVQLVDFGDARVDVVGVTGGHRLHGDGGVPADGDVADLDLARFTTLDHESSLRSGYYNV